MKHGIIFGILFFSIFAEAAVENMGSLISQGYADQAQTYRDLKRAIAGELSEESKKQAQELEDLSVNSEATSGIEIRLASARSTN